MIVKYCEKSQKVPRDWKGNTQISVKSQNFRSWTTKYVTRLRDFVQVLIFVIVLECENVIHRKIMTTIGKKCITVLRLV